MHAQVVIHMYMQSPNGCDSSRNLPSLPEAPPEFGDVRWRRLRELQPGSGSNAYRAQLEAEAETVTEIAFRSLGFTHPSLSLAQAFGGRLVGIDFASLHELSNHKISEHHVL